MEEFNPTRLDLARRRRGMTKTMLADQIGVSRLNVIAYTERRKRPGPETIERIASVLRFPVAFFYGPTLDEPPLEGSSFRALTSLTAAERDQALSAGALALSLADWIDDRFRVPRPSIPRLQDLDPETAAMTVRTEWGIGQRPIKNIVHLLEAHGVRVFSLAEDSRAIDAFSFWRNDTPYVFLNTMKTPEHSRLDAAHELGHLVMHWKGGARGREFEQEAQLFGASFLMPRDSVLAEAPRGGRMDVLIKAKRRWSVSLAALTYRMKTLGLLSEYEYRTLFVQMSQHGYRKKEPNGINAETSQVLAKVFAAMRDEGLTRKEVAAQLAIQADELSKLVFGLVVVPVESEIEPEPVETERPRLFLIS